MLYEFALTQPFRHFLKIERAFKSIQSHLKLNTVATRESALMYLVHLVEFLNRIDIKAEVIKELDFQHKKYAALTSNPNVDSGKLKQFLKQIESLHNWSIQHQGKFSDALKEDAIYQLIHSKMLMTTGITPSESPDAFCILKSSEKHISERIYHWLKNLEGLSTSCSVILRLSRELTSYKRATAPMGDFLIESPNAHANMLHIKFDDHLIYPEISSGKHRISIHFYQLDENLEKRKIRDKIDFDYALCGWKE